MTPAAVRPTGPVDPGAALLRAGTRLALAAAVLVAAVSLFWGWRALLAAVIGGLVATAALAVGPALLHAVRHASAPAVTAAATGGYVGVVLVLGLVFAVLAPASWLSAEHLAVALVVVTVAGIVGQARAVTRLRVLVYTPTSADGGGTPQGGADGDGAQSCRNLRR